MRFKLLKNIALNLCSILKPKKFENNLIRFKSALSKTLAKSKNGDDLLALYPSMFPGVANSTSVLFNQSIALPSYGVLEMIGLHNKAIEQVAKVILRSPIKKLVISGGSRVLFQLIETLHAKKGKQVLDIYFLWHGSSAQWSDPHHLEQFNITRNLYNQKKIQGIITVCIYDQTPTRLSLTLFLSSLYCCERSMLKPTEKYLFMLNSTIYDQIIYFIQ